MTNFDPFRLHNHYYLRALDWLLEDVVFFTALLDVALLPVELVVDAAATLALGFDGAFVFFANKLTSTDSSSSCQNTS